MFGNTELRVLRWMIDHPYWHFPLDLVKAKVVSRWSMVTVLCKLEDHSLVERRDELPWPRVSRPGEIIEMQRYELVTMRRQQFRAMAVRPSMDRDYYEDMAAAFMRGTIVRDGHHG